MSLNIIYHENEHLFTSGMIYFKFPIEFGTLDFMSVTNGFKKHDQIYFQDYMRTIDYIQIYF